MMRWVNGLTWPEEIKRRGIWHRWFAWHPVTIGTSPDGHKIKVWLGWVERRQDLNFYCGPGINSIWKSEYREISGSGVTLIELMVVLLIIGFLAMIFIPYGFEFIAKVRLMVGG